MAKLWSVLGILALLSVAGTVGPASAQWRYDEIGGEARAFVFGSSGTSIGLRCTDTPGDRDHIYLDLMVIPVDAQPDPEEVAQFVIGRWTFDIETIPQERVGALYRYQSRFSYYDPVIENMRRRMMGGSVLRFTRSFDFAPMSFTLSGSRNAISTLEAACPRLWARSRAPAPDPAPAPLATPAPAAPLPSTVPPEALAGLESYVRSIMQPQCAPGAQITLPPDMFRVSGDRVTVMTGLARCAWQFQVNPYCGAARCQSWVYAWDGGSFTLVENNLR